METKVVNIKVAELQKENYENFLDWNKNPNHLYIGRNTTFYVPGTIKSKWCNPFSVKKYGLDVSLESYEKYKRRMFVDESKKI